MVEKLQNKFAEVFGTEGEAHVYFAPGRVNMIGEHTDYNGGHVFPCALTIGTYGVVRKREDNKLRFYSMNFEQLGVITSSLLVHPHAHLVQSAAAPCEIRDCPQLDRFKHRLLLTVELCSAGIDQALACNIQQIHAGE